jgi:hypothetical protein
MPGFAVIASGRQKGEVVADTRAPWTRLWWMARPTRRNFQVKISGHKVPLHTEFHAIVDGDDTYLQLVKAQFLHSFLVARGYVVRVQGEPGRHVYLDVAMD